LRTTPSFIVDFRNNRKHQHQEVKERKIAPPEPPRERKTHRENKRKTGNIRYLEAVLVLDLAFGTRLTRTEEFFCTRWPSCKYSEKNKLQRKRRKRKWGK
jgi:hypothetical protein